MANEDITVAQLFGPPKEDEQTNLMEIPPCPIDGAPCGGPCKRRVRAIIDRTINPNKVNWRGDVKRAERMELETDPQNLQVNRDTKKRVAKAIGCSRPPRLH